MRGAHLALAVNKPKTALLMATVKFFGRYNKAMPSEMGCCLRYHHAPPLGRG